MQSNGYRRQSTPKGRGLAPTTPNGWLVLTLLICVLALLALGEVPLRLGSSMALSISPDGLAAARPAPEPFPRSPDRLLQDLELVYGPGAKAFDTAAFLADRPQLLPGSPETAGAAVEGVARRHSIDPRLLLALLGLDDRPVAATVGDRAARIAVWLADGYYGLQYRDEADLVFADGQRRLGPVEGGLAHFAVARYLARLGGADGQAERQSRFAATYTDFFGPATSLDPPLPEDLSQPRLLLPWAEGQRWHYTGGPHGAWGVASAWGAIDFAPPSLVGCQAAPEWVLAAAPGLVTWSQDGLVLVDLDGDGNEGTGWVMAYLHMAGQGRAELGQWLEAGDPVGHPSCEGGVADGAHLHLARRYNGEWLPASGGPAPLELSAWTFRSLGGEYDGSMLHAELGTRMAVTSRRGGETAVLSDNGPISWAELAADWRALQVRARSAYSTRDDVTPDAQPVALALALPEASGGASAAASIALRLSLEGRQSAATPLVIGLSQDGEALVVLMARTDAHGDTGPILLPPSVRGRFDLIVRVPGFAPAYAMDLDLGAAAIEIDLSAGGRSRLGSGELNGDDVVDRRDILAWLGHWRAGRDLADLNGDGRGTIGDLWRLLRNLARD